MKTAIITGTSSGIGKVTAEKLLKNGWKVYGLSRTNSSFGNENFVWLKCDLAQAQFIKSSIKKVAENTIDLVLSNAGVAFEEPASAASKESYEKMFSVNVLAPILLINALRDKITHSTIISISSVSDRLVDKDYALYCASKAANTRYFESLADELLEARIYTLLPDYVDTLLLRALQSNRDFDWQATLKIEDIAELSIELALGNIKLGSGSNIIIVNNALKDTLKNREKLYGFNTDTKEIIKL